MTQQNFVKFDQFDINRMVDTTPESNTSKPDPKAPNVPGVPYNILPLMYMYPAFDANGKPLMEADGLTQKSVRDTLVIEMPELTSPRGIEIKPNQQGVMGASLFTLFNMTDPKVNAMCSLQGLWFAIHRWCIERLWAVKASIPSVSRMAKDELRFKCGFPLYLKTDPETKQIIDGTNPSKFFKLIYNASAPGKGNRSLFKAPIVTGKVGGVPQYQTIEWDLLTNVEMKFKAMVSFQNVFIGGGKVSIQNKLISGIVSNVVPANSGCFSRESMAEYVSNDTTVDTITTQLRILSDRNKPAAPEKNLDLASSSAGGTAPSGSGDEKEVPEQSKLPTFNGVKNALSSFMSSD